jgi:hypothetical protein
MLYYNNPEIVEAIRDGRGVSTVDDNKRLMRFARSQNANV